MGHEARPQNIPSKPFNLCARSGHGGNYCQATTLFCGSLASVAVRHTHEEAPVALMHRFQKTPLSKSAANDNGLAWPFIPFPEGWYAPSGRGLTPS